MDQEVEIIRVVTERLRDRADDFDFGADVFVRYRGEEFVGTFSLVRDVEEAVKDQQASERFFSVSYYKILGTVLVKDLSKESMKLVVTEMIHEGDFQRAFRALQQK